MSRIKAIGGNVNYAGDIQLFRANSISKRGYELVPRRSVLDFGLAKYGMIVEGFFCFMLKIRRRIQRQKRELIRLG